jgi:HYDIN/CFA65/VesB family protein/ASPM-SPD-2-Hydin domain-containing protein
VGFPGRNAARPAIRRALTAVAAVAMALPAVMLPATPAAATSVGIGLISSSQWTETLPSGATAVHIVGQVQNDTSGNATLVRINVSLTDSIPNDSAWTYATVDVLGPNELSPFELGLFPAPAGYTGYTITTISYATATSQPYHSQLATTLDPCPAGNSNEQVCGSVTNNGPHTVDGVRAILTYLDGSNTTVAQEHPMVENVNSGTTLAPNETGLFQFLLTPGEPVGTGSPLILAEPGYPIDLNPVPLDAGHVNVGETGKQDATLSNTGALPVTVTAVQATPAPEFTASTDCPSGGLAGGQSCHVTVHFTPAALGLRTGTLTITDDAAGNQQTLPLTGTGTAPDVTFNPSSQLDFGSTERAGMPGLTKTVSLINDGTGSLAIMSIGTSASAFTADGSACPMAGSVLAAGAQCTISVTFATMTAGPYAANLVIADNAGTGTQTLPLVAFASGPGDQVSPTSIDFHQVVVHQTSAAVPVTLTNNGNESLTISAIKPTGDFGQQNTCGSLPATLAPAASCTVNVTFTPSQTGSRTGILTITDNTPVGQQSVSLLGTGATSALSFSPASLDFGTTSPGTITSLPDTITNLGNTPLIMTAITPSGDYAETDNCPVSPASLAPSAACVLTVTFSPTGLGTRTGAITISDNTPAGTDVLPLTGVIQVARTMYTLDGYGGIHSDGGSPVLSTTAYWPGWKIARSAALLPDGTGGYVLDGYGGVHRFGSARVIPAGSYPYFGFDIARDVALLPSATPENPMGYTLDGFGGVHPFGGAATASGYAYYAGRDIVLKIVLLSDGTGGYTLDAYGGLHPFAIGTNPLPPSIGNSAYWAGWRIVRGVALNPNSTATAVSGVTLDGYGGVHPFTSSGTPGPVNPAGPYFGWDISRAVVLSSASSAAQPQGWVLDGWGGLHAFGGAPYVASGAYWANFDIAVQLIGR